MDGSKCVKQIRGQGGNLSVHGSILANYIIYGELSRNPFGAIVKRMMKYCVKLRNSKNTKFSYFF